MDTLGLKPVLDTLVQFSLPSFPTILNGSSVDNKTFTFDWVRSIALIQRLIGGDVLFGLDIFPDPLNKSFNRLAVGVPDPTSPLPL